MDVEFAGRSVAIVGAGIMGAGIAQAAAMSGHRVAVCDQSSEQLEKAAQEIDRSLGILVCKGRIDEPTAAAARNALRFCDSVEEAAAGVDLVIEAVVENLEVKQRVLGAAAVVASPHAVLATNTSQLSISSIASGLGQDADRVIGLHFFNPVVLMRLIEIVRGLMTNDATVEAAQAFAVSLGKETVLCLKDSPGFLTSRISAIVRLECLRMLEEGVGTAEDIDRALRLGLNFPIGPLELGDRNGLDTYLLVLESLSQSLGERFRPTVGLRNLVAAGRLGRKTGAGIYDYAADGSIRDADSHG
ncbi:3-hydroxybutyryl-CoA dehydrogenase [Rhodococcus sp. 27YEA15]|uniref:3-hydroxyacyl-CoA dehydrogenase family protein n=1 Tax=Rhodococcus sp. 27YEA15 TaxID=3156259 RepID=UPI003C7D0EDB